MKRRFAAASVLLATAVLMLAAAPSVLASHTTEIDVQSVTVGPGGSVIVVGTVQCTQGYFFSGSLVVRQRGPQNEYNTGGSFFFGTCSSTGPESVTTTPVFGQGPFHAGPAVVQASVCVYAPGFFDVACAQGVQEVLIRP